MAQIDLGSVVGPKGADGANGTNGTDGKSAYQAAVDGGYTGTEAAFNLALSTISDEQTGKDAAGWTLLWTNPSPSDLFSAQSINIENLTNYNFFTIVWKTSANTYYGSVIYASTQVYRPDTTAAAYFDLGQVAVDGGYLYIFQRGGNILNDSVSFFGGSMYEKYMSDPYSSILSNQSDYTCIPLYILGTTV